MQGPLGLPARTGGLGAWLLVAFYRQQCAKQLVLNLASRQYGVVMSL
jgi:hypothetical protein